VADRQGKKEGEKKGHRLLLGNRLGKGIPSDAFLGTHLSLSGKKVSQLCPSPFGKKRKKCATAPGSSITFTIYQNSLPGGGKKKKTHHLFSQEEKKKKVTAVFTTLRGKRCVLGA